MQLIKLFSFVLFLGFAVVAQAQQSNNPRINLLGNWTVTAVELNNDVPNEMMSRDPEAFRSALQKSTFNFNANGECIVRIDADGLDVPKGVFIYEDYRPFIRVIDWRNRDTKKPVQLVLKAWEDGAGITRFSVLETPITFVVKKG